MRAYKRFLEYVPIHTASNLANEEQRPSSRCQFVLAEKLVEEMRELGFENPYVDSQCYVYGWIPASPGCESLPALGLVAHLDTSPDCDGENVRPVLHTAYPGGDIALPNGDVISAKRFPAIERMKGETVITASGGTLLGADDKAGIAEIMTACEEVLCGGLAHPRLCIAFTPDEEIGQGASAFDVAGFGAAFAYTVDGGDVNSIDYETFNAATAKLVFKGVSVHPGAAKGILVNAGKMAMEFAALLPAGECPEQTEKREGFYHLSDMRGDVERAELTYIIRDHDRALFAERKERVRQAAAVMEKRYGPGSVALEIKDSYYNMGEVIEQHFHLVETAKEAIRKQGMVPVTEPMRGGTDGGVLSFMGLPCPNLGTGSFYGHGPCECVSAERMDRVVDVLLAIIERYARRA